MMKLSLKFMPFIILLSIISCISSPETKYEKANKLRAKVQKYELKKYAEEEYKTAEENFDKVNNLIESKKNLKASKTLDIVNNNYQTVLDKGLPPYTDEKNDITKKEKEYAEEIKANVAVKEQFEGAEERFNNAVKYKESKKYEKAIELFNEAKEKYSNAYSTAKEKKDKAKKSIDSTEEAFKELEATASELEKRMKDIKDQIHKEEKKK